MTSPTTRHLPSHVPDYRPVERFWPYVDLPEQPTDEELAALDPDLSEALFGAPPRPFSVTLVFPPLRRTATTRGALEMARAAGRVSRDRRRTRRCGTARGSIRRTPLALRDLFEIVGRLDATEVLIDDRPVPYARELWLPLFWFLIPAVAAWPSSQKSSATCRRSKRS